MWEEGWTYLILGPWWCGSPAQRLGVKHRMAASPARRKVSNMSDSQEVTPEDEIEVGETGGTLRYWAAKEAIRHGELHLTAQAASLSAMEARATSILGWAITGVFALGAVSTTGLYRAAAGFAAAFLFMSALSCVFGLFPRNWAVAGMLPEQVRRSGQETELEVLEHLGKGYDEAIQRNNVRLRSFGHCLAFSWVCFASSPVIAALTAYIVAVSS